jgi:hypothetical protein
MSENASQANNRLKSLTNKFDEHHKVHTALGNRIDLTNATITNLQESLDDRFAKQLSIFQLTIKGVEEELQSLSNDTYKKFEVSNQHLNEGIDTLKLDTQMIISEQTEHMLL